MNCEGVDNDGIHLYKALFHQFPGKYVIHNVLKSWWHVFQVKKTPEKKTEYLLYTGNANSECISYLSGFGETPKRDPVS